jgi:carbonic anhydrase
MRILAYIMLGVALLGCQAPPTKSTTKKKPKAALHEPKAEGAEPAGSAAAGHEPAGAPPHQGSDKFSVPFAYEVTKEEPLAVARGFLREAFADNSLYVGRGKKFFQVFAETQIPRATVITCADSRVQASAWDDTPENDDFTVRNIGNQVSSNAGSVEYGVEHLHTPLLLIIGHTGCGAVKAAMGDTSKLSQPIQAELRALVVPKAAGDKSLDDQWAAAVIANVHNQVSFAARHFTTLVQQGDLTIVGAVYDFRNDLGQGFGKLEIVNVNGNVEPERMKAFVAAILGSKATVAAIGAAAAASTAAETENHAPHADDESLRAMARLSALKVPNLASSVASADYPGVEVTKPPAAVEGAPAGEPSAGDQH